MVRVGHAAARLGVRVKARQLVLLQLVARVDGEHARLAHKRQHLAAPRPRPRGAEQSADSLVLEQARQAGCRGAE